jgi:hypothetical protein
MQQQLAVAFDPVAISAVIVAIVMATSRLAPFTKPYWKLLPKVVQGWLPSLVAGLPVAVNAFHSVTSWLDFVQALLVTGVIPLALAAPGASATETPPPADKGNDDGPKPPSVLPLIVVGLVLLCLALSGCAGFGTEPTALAATIAGAGQ